MEYSTFGRHIAIDVWGVDYAALNNMDYLKQIMVDAAEKSLAKVLSVTYKAFDPCGCTILILLSESHLSIHSYPEQEFAAIDCYTCGTNVDPQIAIDYLIEQLKPQKIYAKTLIRGIKDIQIVD